MSTLKRYQLTTEQAQTIREALSTCDGNWWISVRTGERWNLMNDEAQVLFSCDGTHVFEGITGKEIALFFSPETIDFGSIQQVLECSDIRAIHMEGKLRSPIKTTDLSFLKEAQLLESISFTLSAYLADISPLQHLPHLKHVRLVFFESLSDISPIQNLTELQSLNLNLERLEDLTPLQNLKKLQTLHIHSDVLTDVSPLENLSQLHTLHLGGKQLSDISALQHLTKLDTLHLSGRQLSDISALQYLTKLDTLHLSGKQLSDISALQHLLQLQHLYFNGCSSLLNINSLGELIQLKTLSFSGTRREKCNLTDISPLHTLTNLKTLIITKCDTLVDISPLASLSGLEYLNISACTEINDLHALHGMTNLIELNLGGDRQTFDERITEISSLASLTKLQKLDLSYCKALSDISATQYLHELVDLNLDYCDSLLDITPLQTLKKLDTLIVGCDIIEDLTAIQHLSNLSYLTFRWCSKISDLTPVGQANSLKKLTFMNCGLIKDLAPLGTLENLQSLSISGCEKIEELPPLKNLHSLSIRSKSISDISTFQALTGLRNLNLQMCSSISDITPLQKLTSLEDLNLNRCSNINDLSPIASLKKLEHIHLFGCKELSDHRKWTPITTLPSLKYIEGSFPSYFTAKLFARNAANNQDWEYIAKSLAEWIKTAKSYPTESNLLTQVGRAASVHSYGYESLATIISLSTTNDAPEIDELFATAVPLTSHETIGAAIQSAVDQNEQPLPPETLVALHNHLPGNTTLRDNTIIALTRSISQDSVPEWGEKTAKALREHLNDSRYPITTSVHDDGLSVLAHQQFTPIQSHFFGVLCSGHARSTDIEWRNHFHNLLCGLALSQSDTATRNQALSDISAGLTVCNDAEWVQQRLDYLLKAAAEIDPDTSVIYAAVAHAHAIGGRWDEAQETVSGIASPTVRDASLNKLCTMVLESSLPDKMQRAISCTSALSEPMDRAQKLYELGFHDGLLEDLVAYGQLVGLLTEFPEKQKEVVAHVTEKKPEMVDSPIQTVIHNAQANQWLDLIQRIAPEQYKAILSEYEKNPF